MLPRPINPICSGMNAPSVSSATTTAIAQLSRGGVERLRQILQTPIDAREADMSKLLSRLLSDENGGEVLEYALIAGLIVVAAIAAITTVGSKVLARWTSLDSSM